MATNIPPVLSGTKSVTYIENGNALKVFDTVVVSNPNGIAAKLYSATIKIDGYDPLNLEILKFINPTPSSGWGIYGTLTSSFDTNTGILTLSSVAGVSALQMQNALRSVTYKHASENPTKVSGTVSYTVNDGSSDSNISSATVNLTAVNDAPFFTAGLKNIVLATHAKESQAMIITYDDLKGSGNIHDVDTNAADLKFIISSVDTTKGTLLLNGVTPIVVGTTAITLVDTLTWTPNVSVVTEDTSLNYITPFSVKVSDGLLSSASSVGVKISVENTNQAPIIKGGTAAELVSYTENAAGIAITTLATISDPDGTASKVYGATVSIKEVSGSTYLPEDTLGLVTAASTMGDITVTWDEDTGTLTLVSALGVTAAQMTAALKAIKYTNSSNVPSDVNRTVTYTVSDGEVENGVSSPYTTTIKVTAVNDAPVFGSVLITLGVDVPAQEGVAYSITYADLASNVTDAEGNTIMFAVSTITAGAGKIYKVSGITETEITATNMATTKIATGESFKWVPSNVVTSTASGATVIPFKVKAYDGQVANGISTTELAVSIHVDALNIAPTIGGTVTALTYTENAVATVITSALTVTDSDALATAKTITSAVVSIKAGASVLLEDVLSFVKPALTGDIVATAYDTVNGTITLTSALGATAAEMTAALKGVKYNNTSNVPDTTVRTVSYVVSDAATSDAKTVTINVTAVNDAPVITTATLVLATVAQEGVAYSITYADLASNVTDAEGNTIMFAVSTITAGAGKIYKVSGITETEITATNMATTKIATGESFKWVPSNVVTSTASGATVIPFKVKAYDGQVANGISTTELAVSIHVDALNIAPTIGGTVTALTYTENAVATVITSALTVTDSDALATAKTITSAVVSIKAGASVLLEDVLSFVKPALTGDIVATAYDTVNGTITLTSALGATAAEMTAALKGVKYNNTSNAPDTTARTVSYVVSDAATSDAKTVTINVTAVNDVPVLTTIPIELGTVTHVQEGQPYTISYSNLIANATDMDGTIAGFQIATVDTTKGTLLMNNSAVVAGTTVVTSTDTLTWTPKNIVTALTSGNQFSPFTIKAKDNLGALSANAVAVKINVDDFSSNGTLVAPQSVTITAAKLIAPEIAITAFPIGTFSDGYVTFEFTSATAGKIYEPGVATPYNVTLSAGVASATVAGVGTFTYKLLASDANTLVLAQTDLDLNVEMNGTQKGPPVIWTLIKPTATVQAVPMSGTMDLFTTKTENFGDQDGTDTIKQTIDFGAQTITKYAINGAIKSIDTFTVSNNTIIIDDSYVDNNQNMHYSHKEIQLFSDGSNGYYAYNASYSDTQNWGPNSASNVSNIQAYITANGGGYLWHDLQTGDYAKLVGYNGNTGTYTYENRWQGVTDSTPATLSSNALVVNWGDNTDTYSVVSNTIQQVNSGIEVSSMATSNPFSYFYTMTTGTTTPIAPLTSVTITSAELAAPEIAITAFPIGTFTDGYVTFNFTSATAGTISEPGVITPYNVTLSGGVATATVTGIGTFSYKLIASDTNSLILGQTDTNLTAEMNGQQNGPPAIWTLVKSTATAQLIPTTGILNVFTTKTDDFGDMYGTTIVKYSFDFASKAIHYYAINGAVFDDTYTIVGNKITIAATANNNYHSGSIELLSNGANGYYAFRDTYSDTQNWGTDTANGAANISTFVSNNSGYLWNNISTTGDYAKIIDNGNGTYTYENKWQGNVSSTTASYVNNTLVIDWGDQKETYSVVSGAIQQVQSGVNVSSMTTSNPFNYTYAVDVHNGVGHDGSDMFYMSSTVPLYDAIADTSADYFVFSSTETTGYIVDNFNTSMDKIVVADLTQIALDSATLNITQTGGDVAITINGSSVITLTGTVASEITVADFMVIPL